MVEQQQVLPSENPFVDRPRTAIAPADTAVTAFIGRTLKGPVCAPTTLRSFEDYQRIFGGLWLPSVLSYAVEQFFENGGRACIVVRVCNGGRAPTIRLPAGNARLTLVGLSPGTREFLRASVDYDGVGPHETDRFNLVVQRVRAPGSEFIEDQEIFRRLSVDPASDRNVAQVLATSRLVRVRGELPADRPDRSGAAPPAAAVAYVASNADGHDGEPLSTYDIVGNARESTGLFALRHAPPFNFLCLPPLTRDHDIGLPALLIALRVCRERQAMLLLDPPVAWTDAQSALDAMRGWPLFSEDALMFFPRIIAADRKLGRPQVFGSAAAAAGMLARADQARPLWAARAMEETMLRPGLKPASAVNDRERMQLAQAGVNALRATRAVQPDLAASLCTLTPESGTKAEWRDLAARRFALYLMASIRRGTSWAVAELPGPATWSRAREQVVEFLESICAAGGFAGASAAENYFVVCDERVNAPATPGFRLLFGYAWSRPGEFQCCLVSHGAEGSSVRPTNVNPYVLLSQS